MTFIRGLWVGASIAAMSMAATPGQAAIITQTIDFTATDFTLRSGDGSTKPIDPAMLKFSVTLDNSSTINRVTSGLTIISTNLPFAFQYAYNAAGDILTIANVADFDGCNYGSRGACAFIRKFSTSPTPYFFAERASSDDFYIANTISAGSSAVPEPLTWTMMVVGFGAVGGAMRRRQKIMKTARFA